MPEGDTVHTIALLLAPELTGHALASVRLHGRDWPGMQGLRIQSVTSQGKHLLMDLDDGSRLRSHLGLYGSWHRYRPGEPWQKPARRASLVLDLGERLYVCFNAREVELLRTGGLRDRDRSNRLGPDLTRTSADPVLLMRRACELLAADTPVVDLLLDQRVASGIGNVYKSEILFVTRRSPSLQLGALGTPDFALLYGTAERLLRRNLGRGTRITREVPDERGVLWVYGRAGLPCLVCATAVRRERMGRNPRSTYWCPSCQPAATSDAGQGACGDEPLSRPAQGAPSG